MKIIATAYATLRAGDARSRAARPTAGVAVLVPRAAHSAGKQRRSAVGEHPRRDRLHVRPHPIGVVHFLTDGDRACRFMAVARLAIANGATRPKSKDRSKCSVGSPIQGVAEMTEKHMAVDETGKTGRRVAHHPDRSMRKNMRAWPGAPHV